MLLWFSIWVNGLILAFSHLDIQQLTSLNMSFDIVEFGIQILIGSVERLVY
jgi:hypothetical protein